MQVNNIPTNKYPFLIERNKFQIIVQNSNKRSFNNLKKFIKKKNINKSQELLILSHYNGVKQLNSYSNQEVSEENLYDKEELEKFFQEYNQIKFIYGDGGAFKWKPRISCYFHKNITHILNGLGELENDVILILNDKNLFIYNI